MFSTDQMERYSRQILLREVGGVGQKRLLDACVLVLGAGAMGSLALLYLAGAGVGSIRLVDDGVVDGARLALEPLHDAAHIGHAKALSARDGLLARYPDISIEAVVEQATPEQIGSLMDGVDLLLDCVGTPLSRRLAAAAGWGCNAAVWSGGVSGDVGWVVGTNGAAAAPCLNCHESALGAAFKEAGQAEIDWAARAVLSPMVPGQVGSMLAMEALRRLLGLGGETGQVGGVLFRAGAVDFRPIEARKRPGCPICSEAP
ncbi:MAG: ThiF family adenylyltransferase [Magnetococcales bacterium]|nr:ThiF family adenylyltransferase [Magnetococcales bacterium]